MVKDLPANAGDVRDADLIPGWGRTPGSLLPGESHGQRNLVGYSPWGRKESDTTERLSHTKCERSKGRLREQGR